MDPDDVNLMSLLVTLPLAWDSSFLFLALNVSLFNRVLLKSERP